MKKMSRAKLARLVTNCELLLHSPIEVLLAGA